MPTRASSSSAAAPGHPTISAIPQSRVSRPACGEPAQGHPADGGEWIARWPRKGRDPPGAVGQGPGQRRDRVGRHRDLGGRRGPHLRGPEAACSARWRPWNGCEVRPSTQKYAWKPFAPGQSLGESINDGFICSVLHPRLGPARCTEGIAGLHAGTVCESALPRNRSRRQPLTRPIHDVVAGAVEHEAVVERLMQTHTVLPMRFPTVFASREAVLAMMARHYEGFREDLQRLRNQCGIRRQGPLARRRCLTRQRISIPDRGVGSAGIAECSRMLSGRPNGDPARCTCRSDIASTSTARALSEQAAQFGRKLDAALSEFATAKRLRQPRRRGASPLTESTWSTGISGADFRRAFADIRSSEPDSGTCSAVPGLRTTSSRCLRRAAAPATGAVATDLTGCLGSAAGGA